MSIKNSKTTLLVVIIFCLGLYNSFSALGETNPDPAGEDFIRSLRDQVLSTLTPKELSEAEESEIRIIDTFLPKQLSEEETKKICKETIESLE